MVCARLLVMMLSTTSIMPLHDFKGACRHADPLPGHLIVDAVSCVHHSPRDLLVIEWLLGKLPMDLWPRKDIQVLVMDIDVAQVKFALCSPCYQILTALLHMADGDASPASCGG